MGQYGITNSSQLIDISTITKGCNQIDAAALKFEECANKILNASDTCDENALSVDKTTMQPQLDADAQYIQSIKEEIEKFTLGIKNVAMQIYAAQDQELNDYIAAQNAAKANNGN